MNTKKERLDKVRKLRGLSYSQLIDDENIVTPDALRVTVGRNNDKLDYYLSLIAKKNNISEQWLIEGIGEMEISNEKKTQRIEISEPQPVVTYENGKGRPFYNADWTLGFKYVNDDTVFNPEFNIDFPPANKQGVEWYRAKGNSMLEINSGDYVALEKVEDFSWFPLGRIYGVVTKNGFRTIKKVVQSENKNNYLLKASNPNKEDHPDQDIPKELITGIYKIIYVIKDLDE